MFEIGCFLAIVADYERQGVEVVAQNLVEGGFGPDDTERQSGQLQPRQASGSRGDLGASAAGAGLFARA